MSRRTDASSMGVTVFESLLTIIGGVALPDCRVRRWTLLHWIVWTGYRSAAEGRDDEEHVTILLGIATLLQSSLRTSSSVACDVPAGVGQPCRPPKILARLFTPRNNSICRRH